MYAIFEAKGKQFRAERDLTLQLPSLSEAPGDQVEFTVLLAEQDGNVLVGRPSVEGARVKAEVLRHGRGEKIVVFKMKRRKGYRKKQGHRQGFTEVRIVDIVFNSGGARDDAPDGGGASAASTGSARSVSAAASEKTPAAPDVARAASEMTSAVPDATDTARALAEQHEVDLAEVVGSGKGGRILKKDVEAVVKARGEG